MSKYLAGYCSKCGEKTKQEVIKCNDSVGYRIFTGIFTLGASEALGHNYTCECTRCGKINTISTI